MALTLDPDIYRSVLDSLATGVYVVDLEQRILMWNQGAERLTGYLSQEVLGRTCTENLLMHCDKNCRVLCGTERPLLATIHDGQPKLADVFLRHKDGERIPVRIRAVPIRDADATIIGAAESFDERVLLPEAELQPNSHAVDDHFDKRTGVLNHQSIQSHLAASILDFAEYHLPFCVLAIAIDKLDHLQETHGARATDALLAVVAHTLSRNVHPSDLVGRWGVDRFLVILAACTAEELLKVAEKLRQIISVVAIPWWGDRIVPTISIGGTSAKADDTAERLIGRAQQALERNLAEGGNRATTL